MALRLRRVVTAQQSLPIVDIRDDTIVLADGGLRQVLDCQPTPVSLRDDEEQAAVQEAWAELLHSITHPLQIVIDSRPAHEGDLRSLRSGEVSAALAGIAASYDRLLAELTASSEVVRRTFYAVVPLDASAVMRRRNATEQSAEVARLHERTQTVAQQLDRAGVKSRVLSTGELVEALYSQLNSGLARRQPLVPKDLVANRVRDLIAPSGFERTRDAFTVDQRAAQTLAIVGYPRFLHMDWLQVFVRLRSAARIGLFISPVPTELALPFLEKKIAELASSLRLSAERGRLDAERQAALDDARALQARLVRSEERFFDVAVYATLEAENRQPLEPEVARLETALGGLMLKSRRVHFQMDQGYWSTFPIASDRLGIRRSLTTAGLRVTFPFSASNFSQPKGILYGLEPASGAPVFLDRFALPNANAVVLAQSGAGKSYAVKVEILRALLNGTDVLVIDPEGEYLQLGEAAGGKCESIGPLAASLPNAFALGSASTTERQLSLLTLFRLLIPDLSSAELMELEDGLGRIYAFKGITDEASIEDPEPPSAADLLKTLEYREQRTADASAIATLQRKVRRLLEGPTGWLLRGSDQTPLPSQGLGVISLAGLPEETRSAAMFVVLDRVWQHLRRREPRRKTILVIDEAWWLIRHPDTARFVFRMAKTARKLMVGLTVISQDVLDLLSSDAGKTVITNSAVQLLLKQAPQAIPELAQTFGLTKPERLLLINAPVGEGILIARGSRTALRIVGSAEENRLART